MSFPRPHLFSSPSPFAPFLWALLPPASQARLSRESSTQVGMPSLGGGRDLFRRCWPVAPVRAHTEALSFAGATDSEPQATALSLLFGQTMIRLVHSCHLRCSLLLFGSQELLAPAVQLGSAGWELNTGNHRLSLGIAASTAVAVYLPLGLTI